MPNAMAVFAHPDDETIALGARMPRFRRAHFVHVTDGAPRDEQDSRAHGFAQLADYRAARVQELTAMFAAAGFTGVHHTGLEVPDQEASLQLVVVTSRIMELLATHDPEVVFTHPYEGGHPDHDACAFALHHAVAAHAQRTGRPALIIESPFYHARAEGFGSGDFLPDASSPVIVYQLSAAEKELKHKLVACFTSQQETLHGFHDSSERYRAAPQYDFTQPPHAGKLLYENYPWGMTSTLFSELARAAEAALSEKREAA